MAQTYISIMDKIKRVHQMKNALPCMEFDYSINPYLGFWYAEERLYLLRDCMVDAYYFVEADSPYKAIEKVLKRVIVINNYFKQECDVNTSIREAFEKGFRIGVKKASSAQPERIQNNAVHLCDSCQYTYVTCPSHGNDAVFGDGKGNDNICACNKYRPISAQPEQRWIPCSETKEVPTDEVVVCNKYDEKMVGYLIHMKSGWECDSDDGWMDGVVKWFPLSALYLPEGEEHGKDYPKSRQRLFFRSSPQYSGVRECDNWSRE